MVRHVDKQWIGLGRFGLLAAALCIGLLFVGEAAAESSAHFDLRLLFVEHWQELYSEPLVMEMLNARLDQVTDPRERQDVSQWVSEFAGRGFRTDAAEHRLFGTKHASLRQKFFGAVQKSQFKLGPEFLRSVYDSFRANPATHDANAFTEPSWIEFSAGVADAGAWQSYRQLLESQGDAARLGTYLRLLCYGFGSYPDRVNDLDSHVRSRYLDARNLTPEIIGSLHTELNQSYWEQTEKKRRWMQTSVARRLYSDFAAEQWASLPPETVLALARFLGDVEAPSPAPIDWIKKMGIGIKAAPQNARLRGLLSHFLVNTRISRRESFEALRPLFEKDQSMFVALHQAPSMPSPMAFWHDKGEEDKNLTDCLDILTAFLRAERAAEWPVDLWPCARDFYYKEYPAQRNRLFDDIIRPICLADALTENAVRKTILADVQDAGSCLLDSHRYEIAHNFLSTRPMTATLSLPQKPMEVLPFAVAVYNSLKFREPELYTVPSLKERTQGEELKRPADRIALYADAIIGEPLALMCLAFMGKTDRTQGIAFALDDAARVDQFESLLRRILELQTISEKEFHVELKAFPVLQEVESDIIREMEKAIARQDRKQIVNMVRLTLKITVILKDDAYLDRVLAALRKDVFQVPEDTALFRQPTPEELDRFVTSFLALHSEDLLTVLRKIGKMKYVEKFYDELYVPLRSIDGFLRKTGPQPYMVFVSEFVADGYDTKLDLDKRYKTELDSFARVHGEAGPEDSRYINAEEPITVLLGEYWSRFTTEQAGKTRLTPWQALDRVPLSRNINLGVLYGLLMNVHKEDWRLPQLPPVDRAKCYRAAATIFLDNLDSPNRLDKPVGLGEAPARYDRLHFFKFLNALVELSEVEDSSLAGRNSKDLYDGTPSEGIQRKDLGVKDRPVSRKVDGGLRARLYESFCDDPGAAAPVVWDTLVELVLLLPNMDGNNQGKPDDLKRYEGLKRHAFNKTLAALEAAQSPSDRLPRLVRLCQIEGSVYGLCNDAGFGYEQVRSKYIRSDLLEPRDGSRLAFEEFLLVEMNQRDQGTGLAGENLVAFARSLDQVVQSICSGYNFLRKNDWDSLADAVLEIYRRSEPEKVLESLRPEDAQRLWFLTAQCRKALLAAAKTGEKLAPEEQEAVWGITNSLYFLHSYFLPYTDRRMDFGALFRLPDALTVYCMLDCQVKEPTVQLLTQCEKAWISLSEQRERRHLNIRPSDLKTFLICHNFGSLQLLEACLDDDTGNRLLALVDGQEVKVCTYDFRILWKCEERANVSLDHLGEEVIRGIDLNRDLIAGTQALTDAQYLEFFFGDMRIAVDMRQDQMPRNFDTIVCRMAKLPEDNRLDTLRKRLEAVRNQRMQSGGRSDEDRRKRERLDRAIRDLSAMKDRIDALFKKSYHDFGQVLAERFSSPLQIQKACELAGQNVRANAPPQLSPSAHLRYSGFYESALFGEQGLHADIEKSLVRKVYVTPYPSRDDLASLDYRRHGRTMITQLIEGVKDVGTQGFAGTARMPPDRRTPFDRKYLAAGQVLIRKLFAGEYTETNQPFVGDLAVVRDADGKRRAAALPYDTREADVRELLLWIRAGAVKYASLPEIGDIFAPPKVFQVGLNTTERAPSTDIKPLVNDGGASTRKQP
jgi:hypothetical protein